MRRAALALALLAAGCVTPGRVARLESELAALRAAPAARLGGPDASEPIASIGWVPSQAVKQALLGALGNAPFSGSGGSGVFPSITLNAASGASAITLTAGAKITFGGSNTLAAAATYIVASQNFRTNGTFESTQGSGFNGFAFTTDGARLDLGTGPSDYLSSDGSNVSVGSGLNVNGNLSVQNSGNLSIVATNGTAGSGTGITTNSASVVRTFLHKITVAETALTAASTTEDITIWTVPAKTRLVRIAAESTVGFTGGGLTNMTVSCGSFAGSTAYLNAGSIFGAAVVGDAAAEVGSGLLSATYADFLSFSTTSPISCRFTSTTANVVAATAGSVTFYIEGVTYP